MSNKSEQTEYGLREGREERQSPAEVREDPSAETQDREEKRREGGREMRERTEAARPHPLPAPQHGGEAGSKPSADKRAADRALAPVVVWRTAVRSGSGERVVPLHRRGPAPGAEEALVADWLAPAGDAADDGSRLKIRIVSSGFGTIPGRSGAADIRCAA